MMMSSSYTKMNGRPFVTLSIILWKVLPALRSPKPTLKNSYRPNGMMMAVLAMSLACMGIWW
jgi:hypothetical protein